MDDQSALKEVAKLWGTTSPMAPMSDDELVKDQPHKFPKTRGQFGLRAAKRAWEPRSAPAQVPAQQLQMMAKIIADSPAAPGGGSQLDPVHGGRRARHHTATDADDCDVEESAG